MIQLDIVQLDVTWLFDEFGDRECADKVLETEKDVNVLGYIPLQCNARATIFEPPSRLQAGASDDHVPMIEKLRNVQESGNSMSWMELKTDALAKCN